MSPRSKDQFEAMREKSRIKIIKAALNLFAVKGYYGTSIDDVVKQAKVSKGSAYHYFDSKEALLKAVIVQGLSEFESMMGLIESQESAAEKLETLIHASFNVFRKDIRFWKLYFSLITQMNLPKSIKKVLAPVIEGMLDYIKNLLDQMGVPDAASESKVLGAIMDGVFIHYIMIGEKYPFDSMRDYIISRYIKEQNG